MPGPMLALRHPDLIEGEVIGRSRQGREIAGVALSHRPSGPAASKSAVFVDVHIHAGEVAGNAVAMHCWSRELPEGFPGDRIARRPHRGAEDRRGRSGALPDDASALPIEPPTYPYAEPPDGFGEQDVNGDDHILEMRAADGSRVMRPRGPGEQGGPYYRGVGRRAVRRVRADKSWQAPHRCRKVMPRERMCFLDCRTSSVTRCYRWRGVGSARRVPASDR